MRVFVASGVQHAMGIIPSAIRGLSGSTIFFIPNYLINGTIFEKKKVIEHKMCFDFLYKSV
jgi:hypothetical protein